MAGFFNPSQMQRSASRMMSVPGCGICGLHKDCYSPKMKPTGEGEKGVLFIAEAPGETEDRRGEQLVGKVGQLHRKVCRQYGINLDKDCRKINAVNCRPVKNETPSREQIAACRPNVLKEIKRFKPKMIIPLGGVAIESLLGHRWKHGELGGITRWRGWAIPDRELGCWVCPTYHPSFVIRNDDNKAVEKIYKSDLETAFWILKNKPFPEFEDESKKVKVLLDIKDIKRYLLSIIKNPPTLIAIDYETTGLKPHAKGHKIYTIAFSVDGKTAVGFPYDKRIRDLLIKVLTHIKIWWIAANLKFEETWTRVRIGTQINHWAWDTMLAEHCLDNRKYVSGLKFQVFVHYGLIDYDSHINDFLKGTEDHANSLNRIHMIPIKDLIVYNGLDSLFEYRRAIDQMRSMGILDPIHYFKQRT
jgi:uracil-DNA glycosylase family 4